jgi:hypothetical protein
MTYRARYDEAHLAILLGALPPAPPSWVEAAQELPRAHQAMDDMVARAEADQDFRAAVTADLETLQVADTSTEQLLHLVNGNGAGPRDRE